MPIGWPRRRVGGGGKYRVTDSILGAGGLDYAMYDSTTLDRMWQEATGQTPAALTQPVGLQVGREKQQAKTFAQVMAGQPNVAVPFTNGLSGYNVIGTGGTVTIVSGILSIGEGTSPGVRSNNILQTNRVGRLIVEARRVAGSGVFNIGVGNGAAVQVGAGSVQNTWDTYSVSGTTETLQRFEIALGGSATGKTWEFRNIQVQEVPAHYASQAVNAARPVLQPFYSEKIGAPELVTNGEFDADTAWIKGTGWTIAGGKASKSAGSAASLDQPITGLSGKIIAVTFTVKDYVAGGISAALIESGVGTTPGNDITANGIYTQYLTRATVTGLRFQANAAFSGSLEVVSVKEAITSTGLKFDGSDDNLLTDWFAQAGANCIIAHVMVPTSISSTQIIAGANEASDFNAIRVGLTNTGVFRVTGAGPGNFDGTTDVRGQSVIVALSASSSGSMIYLNDFIETSRPQNISPTVSIPYRIGSRNDNGVANVYFGGNIKRLAFGKTALTLEQFQQIRNEWLAAA